ncbi:MAG: DUF763 domain-containing protein [Candidatus Aenigmarchaeota archaeon]|nr:DUF763 domain-containing protein [Candidatus Aenigmarchaeota archaeon]
MKRTGISDLPLHLGKAPPWLFQRMKKLAGGITEAIVLEYGQDEFLRRLSDPYWFQAFACVLGFDWHSSGTTTTATGALKEAVNPEIVGIAFAGGKGKASRKTPSEIFSFAEKFSLSSKQIEGMQYSSRMSAKVDNTAIQDGYQLYHHFFVFTEKGKWVVVQQGMNPKNKYARRYHWLSENVASFVEEPHTGIACDSRTERTLDMTARKSSESRKASVDIVKDTKDFSRFASRQAMLGDFFGQEPKILHMPRTHFILNMGKRDLETLKRAHELQPENYENLLGIHGVGPKTVRSLALISEVIYGAQPSWEDPVKFSFAHGGKDGIPYPVDKPAYDRSIEILRTGIEQARLGQKERMGAIRRLGNFY